LRNCLEGLRGTLEVVGGDLEIVISDNASSDDTELIVSKFRDSIGSESRIRYFRNETNIGLMPNVFKLFDHAETDHLLFIGDDDELDTLGVERLLTLIRENPKRQFAQGKWPWREPKDSDKGQISKWSYEFGLAWAGVYHIPSCRPTLDDFALRAKLEGNIWGQIGLALVADTRLNNEFIALDFTLGGVGQERPYRYDFELLQTSLLDLLRIHRLASSATGETNKWSHFASLRNFGFRSHAIGLVVESTKARESSDQVPHRRESSAFREIIKTLYSKIGLNSGSVAIILVFLATRRPMTPTVKNLYRFITAIRSKRGG
jgi:glycosyltransferase involved in cell wall biosynthesis